MYSVHGYVLLVIITITGAIFIDKITLPGYMVQHQLGYNIETSVVYLFGGIFSNGTSQQNSNKIYKRNINNNTDLWKHISTTTTSDIFVSAIKQSVSIGNIVYFVGVNNGTFQVNEVQVFDMTTEEFNLGGIPPYNFSGVRGCVETNGTHIFMIGGKSSATTYLNYIQILNIPSPTWHYIEIDINFGVQSCAIFNNQIYVFGGYSNVNVSYGIYRYDILTTQWNYISNISNEFNSGYAIYSPIDHNIYITRTNLSIFSVKKEEIVAQLPLLIPIFQAPAMIFNNTLHLFGGAYTNVLWYPGIRQNTALVQKTTLPITITKTQTCDNNELNWMLMSILSVLIVVIAILCLSFGVHIGKKRRGNIGINYNVGDDSINYNQDHYSVSFQQQIEDDNKEISYRSINSQGERLPK
eukprot:436375_1